MQAKDIKDGNTTLARVISGQWSDNLAFYSQDEEFIQVGTWKYNKGKELLAHEHNVFTRTANRTQEVLFVKKGKLSMRIYSEKHELIATEILHTGDIAIMLCGGHGYDILEDDTEVLEVKNGPYPGAERDRVRF